MSCNTCAKSFSLFRKEKGCPNCGFSYCSKCLDYKIFVPKLNVDAKVCAKCSQLAAKLDETNEINIEPPDAYYRRLNMADKEIGNQQASTEIDHTVVEISERLKRLKEGGSTEQRIVTSEQDIENRLKSLKGPVTSTTDAELNERLAKLKGLPANVLVQKPALPPPDTRTEQEQADDLLKQYLEQNSMDTKYNDEFDGLISDIEKRMQNLKGTNTASTSNTTKTQEPLVSDDEEESVHKIVEKIKREALLEDDIAPSTNDELPFCEICNEDAQMRCLGCKYLFCKRCWLEHKDDDDGCDQYEPYKAPKNY